MDKQLYQAPADCPVCGDQLITTRKGCTRCGTELAGEFVSCPYCALDKADHELLRVFLSSRGNLREVEKHLGVSYPTARTRLDAVLDKLGMSPTGEAAEEPPAAGPGGAPEGDKLSPREQILVRVQNGEIGADVAAQLIAQL